MKPSSACPAHTINYFLSRKFDLDKRQQVKGQHKGQKQFGILIPQDIRNKIIDFTVIQDWSFRKKHGGGGLKTKTNIASQSFREPAIIIIE